MSLQGEFKSIVLKEELRVLPNWAENGRSLLHQESPSINVLLLVPIGTGEIQLFRYLFWIVAKAFPGYAAAGSPGDFFRFRLLFGCIFGVL